VGGLCALGAAGCGWLASEESGRRAGSAHHPANRRVAAAAAAGEGPEAAHDDAELQPSGASAVEGPAVDRRRSGTAASARHPAARGGLGASSVDGPAEDGRAAGDGRRDPIDGRDDARDDHPRAAAPTSSRRPDDADLLVDPLTRLYSEAYLMVALDARIAAARRRLRPVSVVMLEVVRGLSDDAPRPADPLVVADALRTTLREADTAARMNDGRYALVLEDTPENGAIWTVERLRTCLLDADPEHTVWAGVACYPAHAFNLDEIVEQSTAALDAAKEWRQDRIEVASAE
jgi:two-component system cell cycle response regulator